MHYVSLIVEALRGRPRLVFWTAALTQGFLWFAIPSLFYSAPPGELPTTLAIGHEFMLGSYLGPPLAFWLGELAFRIAGIYGVYLLAQVCIVVTYWAVFTLGRAIVGVRHAALAVLLMVGVAAFTVPSVDFAPAVLAAPLWALALLHYWRAIGEDRRGAWFLLAIDLGLLLLASYVGLILFVLLALFTVATSRGRHALTHAEPWVSALLLAIVVFPHAWWLAHQSDLVVSGWQASAAAVGQVPAWAWLAAFLAVSHLGLVLLIVLATGWPRGRRERARAPEIDRAPAPGFGRAYVYVFALAPAFVAIAAAAAGRRLGPLDAAAPLLVLSGLAVITAAGDRVLLYRERLVSSAWLGILVAPPLVAVAGIAVMPWVVSVDPRVAQPANAEGRFFAQTFQRRTGTPLQYVTGDPRLAPLIALTAPSRPHVYFDWAPKWSPWASAADIHKAGGVLVWPASAARTAPPARLKRQFPTLVPEVPQSFERPVQGFLPSIRLGWAVIRPVSEKKP
jgi:4-amino-4-deoxy-L-arabinose transferase-like glycosyltransferase